MSAKRPQGASHRTQTPYMLALVFAGVAVCVYLFLVSPCRDALTSSRRELGDVEEQLRRAGLDLKGAEQVKGRLDELDALLAPFRAAMLTPVLESYAVAAKVVLDPLTADANLEGIDYSEEAARALPLPKPQPRQLYARKPIRMTCTGTYMDIVSFIMRVEKEHPLVALQSFSISGAEASPDRQSAALVFEWPVKGVLTK